MLAASGRRAEKEVVMKKAMLVQVVAFVFLAAGAANLSGADAAKPAPRRKALKIGVVNINDVVKKSTKVARLTKKIQAELKKDKEEIDALRTTLQKLATQIKTDPRADNNDEKFLMIQKAAVLRLTYNKKAKEYLGGRARKLSAAKWEVYKDIERTVAKFAKARGYDLVIKKQNLPEQAPPEIDLAVSVSTVLYYSDAVDITALIADRLNKDYAAKEKKAAREPALAEAKGAGAGKGTVKEK